MKFFTYYSMIFLIAGCTIQISDQDYPKKDEVQDQTSLNIPKNSVDNASECMTEVILTNDDGSKTILYLKCSTISPSNPVSDDPGWGNPEGEQEINVRDIFYVIPQPPGDPVPNSSK